MKDAEIVQAIMDYNKYWNIPKNGLIVSLTGGRVGTWIWTGENLAVKPENDRFKKDFRQLVKNGIIVREPVKKLQRKDNIDIADSSSLRILPVTKAGPGQLDSALKVMGYFMIEADVPKQGEQK